MVNQKEKDEKNEKDETGVKQNPKIERSINAYLGNTVLLFLALLSIVVLVAADVFDYALQRAVFIGRLPQLWEIANYRVERRDGLNTFQHIA